MIFLDRLIRVISKDIYLPLRCYASNEQKFTPGIRCTCQTVCRKPSGGRPQPVYLEKKQNIQSDSLYSICFHKRYTCCLVKKS